MAADSTAMTVEYLRARLLSERSLSRTARQRADQLAKRVVELEDQLRIVTNQRKKAEKAAMEVLSILETQGLSGDFSEVIDSCSDLEEIPCQEKGSHDDHQHAVKEDNSSNMSRPDTSEVDDAHSESESQISPTENRSKILSWKGVNRHAPLVTNGDKKIDHNRQRQRRSFLSAADSFPRHHLGKSCRKIKRKEMGCAVENGKNRSDEFQDPAIKEHDAADEFSNDKDKIDDQTKYDDDNIKSAQNGVHKDEKMEQALEKQAQLILRYQAEEDSQREWEEKFKENNVSSTDVSRLPNGIVRDEKEPNSVNEPTFDGPLDAVDEVSEAKNTRDSAVKAPNESISHDDLDQTYRVDDEGSVKLKKSSQEFEFSGKDILRTRVEDQGIMGVKSGIDSRSSSNLTLPVNSPSYESHSSDQSNLIFLSGHNDNSVNRLGHVLDTLHSAKLSLIQELNKSPSLNHSNNNQNCTSSTISDILGIPTSSAHLFRLPTDGAPAVPRSDLSRLTYYNTISSAMVSSRPIDAFDSSDSSRRTTDTEGNYGAVMPAYNRMYSYPSSLKPIPVRNERNGFKSNYMDHAMRNSLDFRGSNGLI